MELKLLFGVKSDGLDFLLIVPYGIETRLRPPPRGERQSLLIVPYGIETDPEGHQGDTEYRF